MAVRKEMVLYYTPEKTSDDQKRKGVLVRLGIRIRNIAPEQAGQQVGYLAGLPGFAEQVCPAPEKAMTVHEIEKQITLDASLKPQILLTFTRQEYELTLLLWKIKTNLTGFSYRRDKKSDFKGEIIQ